jgi:2-polyprenyl-3-methyl-5-hydroxy-6-metoxy-1,4-benzoquinol methylase
MSTSAETRLLGNFDGVDNDHVAGWALDPDEPTRRIPVEVFYNGRLLGGTVAGFPRPDLLRAGVGDGSNGFFFALPALEDPEQAEVLIRSRETGEQLGVAKSVARQPKCSPNGILAADILRLQSVPLHGLQGLVFDGDALTVVGLHLPPHGDPFSLGIRAAPEVAFRFDYPLPSPAAGERYWYWPNSRWSTYRIEIDLAATTAEGPDYEFAFESDADEPKFSALGRNRIYVPKDFSVYQLFPSEQSQLTRVHRFDNPRHVAVGGYSNFRSVAQIAERYGADLSSANILDWGCGHGRVIRHFGQQDVGAELWGVDVDRENVGWLAEHFPGIEAHAVPLLPPTALPPAHFDLVFGISVMTHLADAAQQAWLRELKRISKPGALVLLTFAGPASVAFASLNLTQEWLSAWFRSGFDDTVKSVDLDGKIEAVDYYRNTKQTADVTRDRWGVHFEVLDILECVFGYQDLAVLRA